MSCDNVVKQMEDSLLALGSAGAGGTPSRANELSTNDQKERISIYIFTSCILLNALENLPILQIFAKCIEHD